LFYQEYVERSYASLHPPILTDKSLELCALFAEQVEATDFLEFCFYRSSIMSAWKLVEAVAEESPVDSPKENASAEQNNRNNGGRFNNCI
jgi:hypothetical protein